jgi:Mor family transcriptional regulator
MRKPEAKEIAEVYTSIANVTVQALIDRGIEQKVADDAAFNVCEEMRDTFGGEFVYMPKERALRAKLVAEKIVSEFNGNNVTQLAKKYNYSSIHIYRILRKARAKKKEAST